VGMSFSVITLVECKRFIMLLTWRRLGWKRQIRIRICWTALQNMHMVVVDALWLRFVMVWGTYLNFEQMAWDQDAIGWRRFMEGMICMRMSRIQIDYHFKVGMHMNPEW
jgi:hypothetical protein